MVSEYLPCFLHMKQLVFLLLEIQREKQTYHNQCP
uniref:Uncharacterized protein n=1 Tax=Populus trichocarpa TaxID=3694 RepID=A0A3N7GF65_POPTR